MRFLLVLILCTAFVYAAGQLDVFLGGGLARQVWALTYATAPGVVTHSVVANEPSSDGDTTFCAPQIHYAYTVAGHDYEGVSLRYGSLESALQEKCAEIVGTYPVGGRVAVRYNPHRPADAILEPGVNGADLFMLMLLTPFNMAAAFLCFLVWAERPLRAPPRTLEGPAVRTIEEGAITRVRLSFHRPILSGVITFIFAVFAGLGVAVWRAGMGSMWFMLLDWAVVLGLSGWVFWRQRRKQEGGAADLVIDTHRRAVELPAHFGRAQRETIPFTDIRDVEVETIERRGPRGSRSFMDEVRLVRKTGRRDLIEEFDGRARADAFARWLRARLGLNAAESAGEP